MLGAIGSSTLVRVPHKAAAFLFSPILTIKASWPNVLKTHDLLAMEAVVYTKMIPSTLPGQHGTRHFTRLNAL